MSKRSDAQSSLRGAAKKSGGSFLTKTARMATLGRLGGAMYDRGFQVTGIEGIKEKHIQAYIESRKDEVGVRTLQNEMAHIRCSLTTYGREKLANSPRISNEALGISGSSRAGTKTGISDEAYQQALEKAGSRSPGLAVVMKLERTLGLRAAEAIRSPGSLATWEKQLEAGRPIRVIEGTKGGRPRDTHPPDRAAALEAVREARAVASSSGGHLIAGASGTLLSAMRTYANQMHRHIGIEGHSLRYAFTKERVDAYIDAGFSRREAMAMTSLDLGHGDGRGDYVARVYLR